MPIWVQKLSKSGGQFRVTLPKDLVKELGLDGARVLEITKIENGAMKIEEYHGKKSSKK